MAKQFLNRPNRHHCQKMCGKGMSERMRCDMRWQIKAGPQIFNQSLYRSGPNAPPRLLTNKGADGPPSNGQPPDSHRQLRRPRQVPALRGFCCLSGNCQPVAKWGIPRRNPRASKCEAQPHKAESKRQNHVALPSQHRAGQKSPQAGIWRHQQIVILARPVGFWRPKPAKIGHIKKLARPQNR